MKNYEIMFIVRPTLSEDEIKKVSKSFEKVQKHAGAGRISSKSLASASSFHYNIGNKYSSPKEECKWSRTD